MEVAITIGYIPTFEMNPSGYIKTAPSPQGEWFRNLVHWVYVNNLEFENIVELGLATWQFQFDANSVANPSVVYNGYVDIFDCENNSSCYICLTFWTNKEGFSNDENVQRVVKQANDTDAPCLLLLDDDGLHGFIEAGCNPNEADPEYINMLIYSCFEGLETLIKKPEFQPWIDPT